MTIMARGICEGWDPINWPALSLAFTAAGATDEANKKVLGAPWRRVNRKEKGGKGG